MGDKKLSVVLATRNEELNIGPCLDSVKSIADEIIVVDESSTDKTRDIAKTHGARVFKVKHEPIFHKTKQKAIDIATGVWVLQLDADERVTPELAKEIEEVINSSDEGLQKRVLSPATIHNTPPTRKAKLFLRHQQLLEQRDGKVATGSKSLKARRGNSTGEVVALFIPRRNFFFGKPLINGGAYPDGVIRLIKKDKARLPSKSVHEVMEFDGQVGWLFNDLEHHDSPTFERYLRRWNRYTDLIAKDFEKQKVRVNYLNLLNYSFIIPTLEFLKLYFRHKGVLDGVRGFIWSLFSSLRFPVSYFKYWQKVKK